MDTFLVRLSKRRTPEDAAMDLHGALRRVLAALPNPGMSFAVSGGAWQSTDSVVSWVTSLPASGPCLISAFEDEVLGVLMYGEIYAPGGAATIAADVFKQGGATAVRNLDGCFGAVVWDKRDGAVVVLSDMVGQRALRWAQAADAVWITPHDTCLVAVGAARVEFDWVSALSSLVVENSVQAKSMLTDVRGLEGNHVLRWTPAHGPIHERLPKLDLSSRLDARDVAGIERCRESVVDRMVAASSAWANESPSIRCELTAGIDSRATLACLLAAKVQDKVVAVTSGAPDSTDMATARRLSQLAHVRHEVLPPTSDDPSHFLQSLRLRAFATNGDTDGKRAAKPVPTWSPGAFTRVEGTSGEIYRGFFYPYFGISGIAPNSPTRVVQTLLARRCRRFATVPAPPELKSRLEQRVAECFAEYASISGNGNDMVDMFYVFERTARWASHVRRSSWSTTRNVFLVPSALREAYRLPSPWGVNVNAHFNLVTRHFPASRRVLINGSRPIDLEGPGRLRLAARVAMLVGQTAIQRVNKRLARKPTIAPADLFAGPLHPVLSDLLAGEASVARGLMGAAGVRRVLDEHKTTRKHGALLGYASTIEVYRELLQEVAPRVR